MVNRKNPHWLTNSITVLNKKKGFAIFENPFINVKNPHLGPRIPFILLIFLGVFSKSQRPNRTYGWTDANRFRISQSNQLK